MTMTFNYLPEFCKEFKQLTKKYKSLPGDLAEFKKVVRVVPLGNSRHFNVLTKSDAVVVVKARLFCRYLKGSSLRIIYGHSSVKAVFDFLEIYSKGDKTSEDKRRIQNYLQGLKYSQR